MKTNSAAEGPDDFELDRFATGAMRSRLTRNQDRVQAALLNRLSLLTVSASVCRRYHPVLIPARGQHRIRD